MTERRLSQTGYGRSFSEFVGSFCKSFSEFFGVVRIFAELFGSFSGFQRFSETRTETHTHALHTYLYDNPSGDKEVVGGWMGALNAMSVMVTMLMIVMMTTLMTDDDHHDDFDDDDAGDCGGDHAGDRTWACR